MCDRSIVATSDNRAAPEFLPASPDAVAAFRESRGLKKPYILVVGTRYDYKNYGTARVRTRFYVRGLLVGLAGPPARPLLDPRPRNPSDAAALSGAGIFWPVFINTLTFVPENPFKITFKPWCRHLLGRC
jgi:hypothetical protein